MNKFKFYFILSIAIVTLFSCSKKEDDVVIVPPRAYSVQYTTDITDIEEYLNTYYIESVSADFDIKLSKIPAGGTQKSIKNQTTYKLMTRKVKMHDVEYLVYYLVLREGSGEKPSNVDGVFAAYKGDYLTRKIVSDVSVLETTEFEVNNFPNSFFGLTSFIVGWSEIFPQFKTGKSVPNPIGDGSVIHEDFGAGVMFVPSGLAYYNRGANSIPAYAPLIFSFKLYAIERYDHDGDGIMSFQEDLNGDGYMYDFRNKNNYPTTPAKNEDDTDEDGAPDFIDQDDDGDGFSTKLERKYIDVNGVTQYYDFASIPLCSGGNGKKRHLDTKCHD
jgi:FKBP-type peptidyl-prolyl cis-trans isomerase